MSLCASTSMPASILVDLRTCVGGITLTLAMVAGFQVLTYQLKVYIRKSKSHSLQLLLILRELCLLERLKLVASEYSLTAMLKSKRKENQKEATFLKISSKILGSMLIATINLNIHSLRANLILKFLRFYGTNIGSKLYQQALF